MANKHTKKALFMSALSILLCLSMLVGSTFAWFTDTASTGVNTIVAGNLDIVLEYLDKDGNWTEVNDQTLLFNKDALYEPGYTEVAYLKIRNAGTLALKYKLSVNAADEKTGTNVKDESFKLSDYLQFGQVVSDTEIVPYANRAAAQAAVSGNATALKTYTKEEALEPSTAASGKEVYIALVVFMPEKTGNEANYKTGTDAPSIKLGVELHATQKDAESDSFDNTYDKDAIYSDSAEVKPNMPITLYAPNTSVTIPANTLEEGKVVKLKVENTDAPDTVVTVDDTLIAAKDISIVDENGDPVTMPDAAYSVTMNVGAGLDASKLALYHNTEKVEPISYDETTGVIAFTTNSFSPFTAVLENIGTIDSAAKLKALRDSVNAGDTKAGVVFTLTNDIDLSGVEWTAMKPFAGTFDGQGHTISNLKDAALFGTITETGVVKNLNLKDVSKEGALGMGGFLAGHLDGKAEYCTVKNATATSTLYGFSGMFGFSDVTAVIDHCSVDNYTLTVTNTGDNLDKVGGLVGQSSGTTITNSSVSNITLNGVYKTKEWGGFVGRHANYGTIENCTATNVKINVSDYAQSVGGFVGAPANATIKNCDVNGVTIKVNNCGWVGGFAGYIGDAQTYNFDDCNVTGMSITLETDAVSGIGGFCGRAAYTLTIKNSSVEGTIDASDAAIATDKIKALVGYDRVDQYPDIMVTENNTTNVTIK